MLGKPNIWRMLGLPKINDRSMVINEENTISVSYISFQNITAIKLRKRGENIDWSIFASF
jgi:hypothetical protein